MTRGRHHPGGGKGTGRPIRGNRRRGRPISGIRLRVQAQPTGQPGMPEIRQSGRLGQAPGRSSNRHRPIGRVQTQKPPGVPGRATLGVTTCRAELLRWRPRLMAELLRWRPRSKAWKRRSASSCQCQHRRHYRSCHRTTNFNRRLPLHRIAGGTAPAATGARWTTRARRTLV